MPDAINQTLFSQLFAGQASKSQKTKMKIVEAAIHCYAVAGLEGASSIKIAKAAKVSRPLIQHYFPDADELFLLCARHIRAVFQEEVISAIQSKSTPRDQLVAYVEACFDWLDVKKDHVKVWILFYYLTSLRAKFHAAHTELVELGHMRITALIRLGTEQGSFKTPDYSEAAKLIQTLITGSLVVKVTEKNPIPDKKFRQIIVEKCLQAVGAN